MNEEKIIAVMVSYNPPDGLLARIGAVLTEVNELVIVDNASRAADRDLIQDIQAEFPARISTVFNSENRGLAAALNQGISGALEAGADWVLLLDHDSQPAQGMVSLMLNTYASWKDAEKIALIAPNIADENVKEPTRYLMPKGRMGFRRMILRETATDEALTVITSGSLIKAATFREFGLMPAGLFIDYIDHAFCLRLRTNGRRILLVRDAMLHHRVGQKTQHRLLGKTIVTSHHSDTRRFYIFRNRIWIWRRYGPGFPGFVLHDFLASTFDIFRILVYEGQKRKKLKAILKGIMAGLHPPCFE